MLQTSGPISLGDVNDEIGNSTNSQLNMNNGDVRVLAGRRTGRSEISMSDLYGKSKITSRTTTFTTTWETYKTTSKSTNYNKNTSFVVGTTVYFYYNHVTAFQVNSCKTTSRRTRWSKVGFRQTDFLTCQNVWKTRNETRRGSRVSYRTVTRSTTTSKTTSFTTRFNTSRSTSKTTSFPRI